jgi:hypothetical protein
MVVIPIKNIARSGSPSPSPTPKPTFVEESSQLLELVGSVAGVAVADIAVVDIAVADIAADEPDDFEDVLVVEVVEEEMLGFGCNLNPLLERVLLVQP